MSNKNGSENGRTDGGHQPRNGSKGPQAIHVPGQETPGASCTPLEAIEAGFLTLCKQYQQMGEQLKWMSEALTAHRQEQDIRAQLRAEIKGK